MSKQKYAVLSLSGGMDSSTLLLHLLEKKYDVIALSFDYGQKHKVELERAKELVEYINQEWNKLNPPFDNDKNYSFYPVVHQVIKLDGLSGLLNSTLVEGGKEVPEGHYEQDNMKDTVVPNRNKIFSSIIQAVALSQANKINNDVVIALGLHAGDHRIYLDCRKEFRDTDYEAFKLGNEDSEKVTYYTPYLDVNKFEILQDGELCCKKLGLNFDEIYKRTNTSYKPIQHSIRKDLSTLWEKKWYSDYKSASSIERIEAFIKLGKQDPVEYANEFSPVDWETAKNHALNIIQEYNEKQRSVAL